MRRFTSVVVHRRTSDAGHYPVELKIELTDTDFVGPLVRFLLEVKNRASQGHSFSIVADEDDPFKCSIDGDGADHIGRIFLNGKDVTKE